MGHEVLTSQDYDFSNQVYLVDNGPWQEKIKNRIRLEESGSVGPWPTLGLNEFKPNFLPENPEAEGSAADSLNASVDVIAQAQEKAKAIEQSAKKNAYEVAEKARWEADEIINTAKEEAEKEAGTIRATAMEKGQQEGFTQGHQEGFAQGEIEGKNSYSDLIKNLNGVLESLVQERKELVAIKAAFWWNWW